MAAPRFSIRTGRIRVVDFLPQAKKEEINRGK